MREGILSTIGHTPLVELNKLFPGQSGRFYAKLEMQNPGGSTKDRTALRMLENAIHEGKITKNSTVIESSSGNMAIGLAQVCRYHDINLVVVADPKINTRTVDILKAYGARIERVTRADSEGNYLKSRLQRVKELLNRIPGGFWPNQYANELNPGAHHQTMEEIIQALSRPPDYLLAATSTCGTIMGCAQYARANNLKTKMVAVDAVGSVIFDYPPGTRLIPGHGAGRKSALLDEKYIGHVFHITDEECVIGCRQLLFTEAILAGGSAGAVVMAAKKLQDIIPANSTCALIFSDSGERYMDTIYNDDWVESHFGRLDWDSLYKTELKQEIDAPAV